MSVKKYTAAELSRFATTPSSIPDNLIDGARIKKERDNVERFIRDGGRAYGFTTLFGHMDNTQLDTSGLQHDLMDAHCVSAEQTHLLSAEKIRAVSLVKCLQALNGGTGISFETYEKLTEVATDGALEPFAINLDASYGSGDVAVGAQFFTALLGENWEYKAGDVMALINGSFFPLGMLIAIWESIVETMEKAIATVEEAARRTQQVGVQLPVSLRDTAPLQDVVRNLHIDNTITLPAMLNNPSGNPLFVFDKDNTTPISNSSFLNFPLRRMLIRLQGDMDITCAYIRAATLRVCADNQNSTTPHIGDFFFVQPPKVSTAYAQRLSALAQQYFPIIQTESLGVEDISDGCLQLVRVVEEMNAIVHNQSMILRRALDRAE